MCWLCLEVDAALAGAGVLRFRVESETLNGRLSGCCFLRRRARPRSARKICRRGRCSVALSCCRTTPPTANCFHAKLQPHLMRRPLCHCCRARHPTPSLPTVHRLPALLRRKPLLFFRDDLPSRLRRLAGRLTYVFIYFSLPSMSLSPVPLAHILHYD